MTVDIDPLWRGFKDTGDLRLRNELVLHYGTLVKYVASRVGASMPATVERDDLVAYGQIGLIDAIDRFDLSKNVKFETYAIARIRGAIIDELRALDWVPRSIRAKAKDVDRMAVSLEGKFGRAPEDAELAEALGISIGDLWIAQSQAHITAVTTLDEFGDDDDRQSVGAKLFDVASDPEDIFAVDEVSELVARAVAGLPERSKTILILYYIEEMTLAEIGEILGVTESRVCQLQSKLLHGMRENLGLGRVA